MGDVGNPGRSIADVAGFSICPETHRRILEIEEACERLQKERDGYPFHFSEFNDGDYWYFFLSECLKKPQAVAYRATFNTGPRLTTCAN